MLTCNDMIEIYRRIKHNQAGYRVTPGTALINDRTGEAVYEPPQSYDEIVSCMSNLEKFINDDSVSDLDPLVKMCIIHHQFESIHPFSDGNGRTGRIINILYLVIQGLLDLPVLYLSRYIIKNKGEYYHLLQAVRDNQEWEAWVLFLLKGLEETSQETVELILKMKSLMMEYKRGIREQFPKIYSQDLLNNLFKHPYTKIDFVCDELGVSRPTATSYLNQLVDAGFLTKMKLGRDNFYLNMNLFDLLINAFHVDINEANSQQVETIG
ncbi:Fic family protein [Bacteroides fragilis]|uniref:Fic family protein n=1 Tax=Bacteroides fragilis TaxID=817 RepID=UPI0025B00E3A|nr:Fic family protein [Bacteroides fragilis]